jgi:hypothetical protein
MVHADSSLSAAPAFVPPAVPGLEVDTTDGYRPRLDEIVEFLTVDM